MATRFCRHIHTSGARCGSPALRTDTFCYFHTELGKRHRNLRSPEKAIPAVLHPMTLQDGTQRDPILAEPSDPSLELHLPPLEDRHSIQLALSLVITALAERRIDPKHAAMLFYGLQVASANAHQLNPTPQRAPGKVRETILHEPSGELIAPDADPEDDADSSDYERPSTVTRYLLQLEARQKERERLKAEAAVEAVSSGETVSSE